MVYKPRATSQQAFIERGINQQLPVVLVQIDEGFYEGPSFPSTTPRVAQITYVKSNFLVHKSVYVTRKMLPLELNYAMTIYKVQGLTLDRLIFDLTSTNNATEIYVALSRVRKRSTLRTCGERLTFADIDKFWASKDVLALELERQQLLESNLKTSADFIKVVARMKKVALLHNRSVVK